jgi:hypothetical protein
MGTVYRATQLSLNRVVALKLLAAELSDDPGFRTRFQREGQLQAGLDHQHIVTIHEAGQADAGLFLAMRLIAGPTLKHLIVTDQLDPRRTVRILAQVAQALDSAHDAGLIHRDVKPQNILIGQGDHAYLADFGLTKAPDDAAGLTGTGQFVGTTDYAAPEQIRGERASAASDCYSLAAVLYECLTRHVPFSRPTETGLLQAHLTEPPPRVTERRQDLPVAIDDVIGRGMAKDPSARPVTATELIREATRALASASRPARETAERASTQPTRLAQPPGSEGLAQTTHVPGTRAAAPLDPIATGAGELTRPAQMPSPGSPASAGSAGTAGPPRAEPARGRAGLGAPGVVVLLLLLAAGAIAAGLLVGNSSSGSSSPKATNFASAGPIQLRYTSAWQIGSGVATVPGLPFSNPVKLVGVKGGGLTAGEITAAGGPSLLSASFRRNVLGGLPPAVPVRLGTLEAYRYARVRVRGLAGPLTLYVVPTSAGVVTIACSAPRTTGRFENDCAQVAATLRVVGARAFSLGPSADYARRLSSIFATLRAAASAPLAKLQAARTPAGQASAGQRLAAAYASASHQVSGVASTPLVRDAGAAIAAALHQVAGGYSAAARAARAGNSAAYRRAEAQIKAGSAALAAALKELSSLGYAVGG